MNFDNMEPDYKKDEESDLQKMARQTNKNVFLAVTAGVFISLGFAAIILLLISSMRMVQEEILMELQSLQRFRIRCRTSTTLTM